MTWFFLPHSMPVMSKETFDVVEFHNLGTCWTAVLAELPTSVKYAAFGFTALQNAWINHGLLGFLIRQILVTNCPNDSKDRIIMFAFILQ